MSKTVKALKTSIAVTLAGLLIFACGFLYLTYTASIGIVNVASSLAGFETVSEPETPPILGHVMEICQIGEYLQKNFKIFDYIKQRMNINKQNDNTSGLELTSNVPQTQNI